MSLPNNSALESRPASNKKPILCYVTDRRGLQAGSSQDLVEFLLKKIELATAAGVDWIQLRERDLPGKQCSLLTREALQRISKQPRTAHSVTRIFINDRLDVALAEQAGGVHLGENSLRVEEAKRLLAAFPGTQSLPPNFLVGVSCHSLDAARSAAASGADYLFFGPVFATPSKATYGSPQGLDRLAEVCASVAIPVLAIGGITTENIHACLSAGASGIAAIRLFQDSADLMVTVNAIRPERR